MYSFAHPIEDALENITHSICTLEFEDQRPFYDWTLERIVPILRAPQFAQAKALIEKIEAQGLEAGKEFALHCHNLADKLFASPAEGELRALFRRWDHDRDAVIKDLPAFFALLKKETAQFTPLLAHALDGQRPNVFLLPHQHEFARLNLTYVITSKRKLAQLVNEGRVSGWDDPRMPTIVGLRRRGYTPESIQLFAERIGVTKDYSWIDYSTLEGCLREDLDATRRTAAMAVLDPVKLVITNWDEAHGQRQLYRRMQPSPPCPSGRRPSPPRCAVSIIGREVWIEREDFEEVPPKGYNRLFPGNKVRLKYGYVIECTGCGEGCRRPGDRSARQASSPTPRAAPPAPTASRSRRHHLGRRGRRRGRRSAPVRPPVHRPATRRRRQGLPGQPEPGQPADRHRLCGALTGPGRGGRQVPVRAAWASEGST